MVIFHSYVKLPEGNKIMVFCCCKSVDFADCSSTIYRIFAGMKHPKKNYGSLAEEIWA